MRYSWFFKDKGAAPPPDKDDDALSLKDIFGIVKQAISATVGTNISILRMKEAQTDAVKTVVAINKEQGEQAEAKAAAAAATWQDNGCPTTETVPVMKPLRLNLKNAGANRAPQ